MESKSLWKKIKLPGEYTALSCHGAPVGFHSKNWGVMAERIRAPSSSSGVSVQQSVGSNPGRDTCVPEQDSLL